MLKYIIYFAVIAQLVGCRTSKTPQGARPVHHTQWDALLQANVSPEGWVDYKGFVRDSAELNSYLELLSSAHPNKKYWSEKERLAYWINAYNAFTIRLVIRHYPIESIKKITWTIPFLNSPWKIKFIQIQGVHYSLGNIEHDILRKQFDEPRIHFAINCASYSCPPLSNTAYTAEKIDRQLDRAAKRFINDPLRNIITPDQVKVSSIFLWFRRDFTKKGSLRSFLNQYSKIQIQKGQRIRYMKYDWSVNELRKVDN